jgi:hypothetical protein
MMMLIIELWLSVSEGDLFSADKRLVKEDCTYCSM